jgi:hypothetical protein
MEMNGNDGRTPRGAASQQWAFEATARTARTERTERLQGTTQWAPTALSGPALVLVSKLLADVRAGALSDAALQSQLLANRTLIGDSWAQHIRSIHRRCDRTAAYSHRDRDLLLIDNPEPDGLKLEPEPEPEPEPAKGDTRVVPETPWYANSATDDGAIPAHLAATAGQLEALAALCRCRVWNKGQPKQCANVQGRSSWPHCTMHAKIIARHGGWPLGYYDEPRPDVYLCDSTSGSFKKGQPIPWKPNSPDPPEPAAVPADQQVAVVDYSGGSSVNTASARAPAAAFTSSDAEQEEEEEVLSAAQQGATTAFGAASAGTGDRDDAGGRQCSQVEEVEEKDEEDEDEAQEEDEDDDGLVTSSLVAVHIALPARHSLSEGVDPPIKSVRSAELTCAGLNASWSR